ncbi:unnamed protein product [Brassica rapa]|uniref:Uncharacterized protein n=2 Tax=Brassica TaxID=3705 RepID=A0A8D9CV44_BRACM|nr:unnamed protein product [Brassica napus]CAG7865402.1 unnamed protein product [Brassica rapa]
MLEECGEASEDSASQSSELGAELRARTDSYGCFHDERSLLRMTIPRFCSSSSIQS